MRSQQPRGRHCWSELIMPDWKDWPETDRLRQTVMRLAAKPAGRKLLLIAAKYCEQLETYKPSRTISRATKES